jgi:peptidoglycan/xylan/chitin deacetylase (PgdA/CDA1 family)
MRSQIKSFKFIFSFIVLIIIALIFGGAKYFGDNVEKYSSFNVLSTGNLNKFKYLESKKDLLKYEGPIVTQSTTNARFIKVLVYHGIVEKADGENVEWDKFRDQMFVLKKAGYQTVKINDVFDYLHGVKTLPDKSFLLTFDDGRKDSYYPVEPVLEVLDYNAVMFVITGRMSAKETFHLSKNEFKQMLTTGRWELEAHANNGHTFIEIAKDNTQGHYYANKMWIDTKSMLESDDEYKNRITSDLKDAKDILFDDFKIDPIAFAVPYGDFGQEKTNYPKSEQVIMESAKKIYSMLFYQSWDPNNTQNYPLLNSFSVKRVEVLPDWNADTLLRVMNKN